MSGATRVSLGVAPRWLALVGALALLFALVPLAGSAEAAHVEQDSGDGLVPSVRWAGDTRFHTASKIAMEFDGQSDDVAAETDADTVVLARGDLFPDALSGSFIAGQYGAPIVLSDSSRSECQACFDVTMARIDAIAPQRVVIVGGTAAVPQAREDALVAAGYEVIRFGGAERVETASLVARGGTTVGQHDGLATAIVARAGDFPDALVAGTFVFDQQFPLLLTPTDELADVTADALVDLGIEQVIIAGGTGAVSAAVETELAASYETIRLGGSNRQQTAVELAEFAYANFGWVQDEVSLARGDDFADALTVGPFAGMEQHAIVLAANPTTLGNETSAFLAELATCTFDQLYVAGGTAAISEAVEQQARTLVSRPGVACNLALTPQTATNLVGEPHTVTATVVDTAGDTVNTATAVTFEVAPESGSAATPTPQTATVTTTGGMADFVFTSPTAGDVVITATFTNADGQTVPTTASKTFTAEPAVVADDTTIELIPQTATNFVDAMHTVTAQLGSTSGNEVSGVDVTFVVTGADATVDTSGLVPESGTVTTVADGSAQFPFTSSVAGDFLVTATFTNADGVDVNDTVEARFVVDPPPTAVSAEFTEAVGGANNGTFGNTVGDVLTITYDETIVGFGPPTTVTVDINGPATDGGISTIACGTLADVVCSGASVGGLTDNQLVMTVANVAAGDVMFDSCNDTVIDTFGIEDSRGNPDENFPVEVK